MLQRVLALFALCSIGWGAEATPWGKLQTVLEVPSSQMDLYKAFFMVCDTIEPVEKIPGYLSDLNQLAISVGESVDPEDPASYLRELARILYEQKKFAVGGEGLLFRDLLFHHVLVNKRGPEVALGVVMLAGLRNIPNASALVVYEGRYFVRSGPAGGESFLDIQSGKVMAASGGALVDLRLQAAPVLTKRQVLGHYLYQLAKKARKEGLRRQAEQLLKNAWHLAPQLAGIYMETGRIALEKWDLTRAERCFDRAIVLDSEGGLLPARVGLADVYVRQQRFSDARVALENALVLDNDDFYALLVRGEYFLMQEHPDYRAAQDVFESLLGRQSAVSDRLAVRLLCRLALTCLGRKDTVNGKRYLEKAQQRNTNFALFYYTRAHFKEDMQALGDYIDAVKINPNFAPAYLKRAVIYENLNMLVGAIEYYRKFIELLPQHSLGAQVKKRIETLRAELGSDG